MFKNSIRYVFILSSIPLTISTSATRLTHAGQVFWTAGGWAAGQVYKANLSGSAAEQILSSSTPAHLGITLDGPSETLLDGSNAATLIASATSPMGIAVDNPVPLPGSIILLGSGLIGLIGINFKKRMSRSDIGHQKA